MSALRKRENGWCLSGNLEVGLEGREVEGHLIGVGGSVRRIASLGTDMHVKESQPLVVHE